MFDSFLHIKGGAVARETRLTKEERERFGVSALHFTRTATNDETGDGVLWTADKKAQPANHVFGGEFLFNHKDGRGRDKRRRTTYTFNSARLALGLHRRKLEAERELLSIGIQRVLEDARGRLQGWVSLSLSDRDVVSQALAGVAGELDGVVSPPKVEALVQVAASVSLKTQDPRRTKPQYNPMAISARLTKAIDEVEERLADLDKIEGTIESRQGWLLHLAKPEDLARRGFADRLALGEWDRYRVTEFRTWERHVGFKPATQEVNWVNRQIRQHGSQGLPADVTAIALQGLHLGRLQELLDFPAALLDGKTQLHLADLDQESRVFYRQQWETLLDLLALIRIDHEDYAEWIRDLHTTAVLMVELALTGDWSPACKLAEHYRHLLRYRFRPGDEKGQQHALDLWYSHPLPAPAKA